MLGGKIMDQRYRGGFWAALFLILLLPLLFVGSGRNFPGLGLPVRGLRGSVPKARLVWEFYGGKDQIPVWLGGPLAKQQPVTEDSPGVLVAVAADGNGLWSEKMSTPFTAISDGEQLIVASKTGQLTKFIPTQGALWSVNSDWETQTLVLALDGQIVVAQGPILEGQSNLLERVCIYDANGNLVAEHVFRNNSVIDLDISADNVFVSTINLAQDVPSRQLFSLAVESAATQLLWQNEEIIFTMAAGSGGIAAAAGDIIYLSPAEGEDSTIKMDYPVTQLAWAPGGMLTAIEVGTKPTAATLLLMESNGKRCWQQSLKGDFRALVVRGDEIIAADSHVVYCYSGQGNLKWCYQSPAAIKGLHPLAAGKRVVVTTMGNHLLLLEPPPASDPLL